MAWDTTDPDADAGTNANPNRLADPQPSSVRVERIGKSINWTDGIPLRLESPVERGAGAVRRLESCYPELGEQRRESWPIPGEAELSTGHGSSLCGISTERGSSGADCRVTAGGDLACGPGLPPWRGETWPTDGHSLVLRSPVVNQEGITPC